MSKLIDATLEWKLLSALFEDPDSIRDVADDLFTDYRKEVFTAVKQCYIEHGSVDYDGVEYFLNNTLPGEILNAAKIKIKIAIQNLHQLYLKRVLFEKQGSIQRLLSEPVVKESDFIKILELPAFGSDSSRMLLPNPDFIQDMEDRGLDTYTGRSTGLTAFDSRIGGEWKAGKVYLVAAPSGVGKTTFAVNAMLHMAFNLHEPTSIFSLEMTKSDLIMKWVAMVLQVNSQRLQSGKPEKELLESVKHVVKHLNTLPLYIIEDQFITLPRIISEIRHQAKTLGVRTFFLDYLQIANHAPTGNVNKDLGQFVWSLKSLAKELLEEGYKISIVILSQLNREGTIRDTGEAENHVDVVCVMMRNDDSSTRELTALDLEFRKNRLGPIGKTLLWLNGETNTFNGMEFVL